MESLAKLGAFFPGSRIGIMLVHGLAGTPTELGQVSKGLNKHGFSVLCPLLSGHCGSYEDLTATGRNDWTNSVASAFAALSEKMDVVFLGGLSAGAVFSLYQASRASEAVRGLALYSTTFYWDGWSITRWRFLLPLVLRLPYIGKRYRFEEVFPYGLKNARLRERIHASMQSGDSSKAGLSCTPGVSLRELWRLVDEVKEVIPAITTPTLLVHARHDDIASSRNAQYVMSRIGGPAQLLYLDESYHLITVDQERGKVIDSTAAFFHSLLSESEREELARHAKKPMPDLPEGLVPGGTLSRRSPGGQDS